jgi:hypothetical protein
LRDKTILKATAFHNLPARNLPVKKSGAKNREVDVLEMPHFSDPDLFAVSRMATSATGFAILTNSFTG